MGMTHLKIINVGSCRNSRRGSIIIFWYSPRPERVDKFKRKLSL